MIVKSDHTLANGSVVKVVCDTPGELQRCSALTERGWGGGGVSSHRGLREDGLCLDGWVQTTLVPSTMLKAMIRG